MSVMIIVAIFAFIRKIFPIQGICWIVDVLRREGDLVMDDIAQLLSANFAHSCINPDPLFDVSVSATLPCFTTVECFSPNL